MKLKKTIQVLLTPFALLGAPVVAFAQANAVQSGLGKISSPFGGFGGLAATDPGASVASIITQIINILLLLAGIVAVLFIIIGGYQYITSAGNAETAEKGKSTMINAIIGIVIILLSFVIINVIVNLVGNGTV